MKSPYFLKNWRVYRALVCLAFAGGIVVAMLNHRDALERQTLTSISSHIMSSWSLSDLFFDTMRLSEQVQDFELGRGIVTLLSCGLILSGAALRRSGTAPSHKIQKWQKRFTTCMKRYSMWSRTCYR